jgi:competence ComEA-like helix-hairpin-helix protein
MHNHPAMLWRWQPIRIALAIFFLSLAVCGITAATTKKPPSQPVNINTATAEELQHVPGIGPATAVKILQMRKSYGAFKSVDDLLAIRGIGKKRLEKMRRYLTVGKITAPKAAPCAANPTTPQQKPPEKMPAKP